jgi:hypothetical protein
MQEKGLLIYLISLLVSYDYYYTMLLKVNRREADLPNFTPNIKLLKLFSFTPVINTIFATIVIYFYVKKIIVNKLKKIRKSK